MKRREPTDGRGEPRNEHSTANEFHPDTVRVLNSFIRERLGPIAAQVKENLATALAARDEDAVRRIELSLLREEMLVRRLCDSMLKWADSAADAQDGKPLILLWDIHTDAIQNHPTLAEALNHIQKAIADRHPDLTIEHGTVARRWKRANIAATQDRIAASDLASLSEQFNHDHTVRYPSTPTPIQKRKAAQQFTVRSHKGNKAMDPEDGIEAQVIAEYATSGAGHVHVIHRRRELTAFNWADNSHPPMEGVHVGDLTQTHSEYWHKEYTHDPSQRRVQEPYRIKEERALHNLKREKDGVYTPHGYSRQEIAQHFSDTVHEQQRTRKRPDGDRPLKKV